MAQIITISTMDGPLHIYQDFCCYCIPTVSTIPGKCLLFITSYKSNHGILSDTTPITYDTLISRLTHIANMSCSSMTEKDISQTLVQELKNVGGVQFKLGNYQVRPLRDTVSAILMMYITYLMLETGYNE
jgi:hypothetical protein